MDMSTFTVEKREQYLMADDRPFLSNSCVVVREEGPVAALVRGLLVAVLPTGRLQGVWVDGASHAGRVHACISALERNGPQRRWRAGLRVVLFTCESLFVQCLLFRLDRTDSSVPRHVSG